MTKQERKNLDFVLRELSDNYWGCDYMQDDIVKYIEGPDTPVRRFLNDFDACFAGQLEWLKYDTCEKAVRAAHRSFNYEALEWFLNSTVNRERDDYGNPIGGWQDADDENGDKRPLKFFLDLIPKKYRTAEVASTKKGAKKSTKKAAKKAVKRGSSKKR